MKKLFITIASMFFMFACTQEEVSTTLPAVNNTTSTLTTAQAQVKFAKILSKAASDNIEVRKFLKNEATKQFDNDYDVFYPLVKDKIVAENKSFRDILLSYCENEKDLSEIEQSQLLLNILIPDLTIFWDFNAEKWDVNNKEIVVLCRDDESNSMYENGENIGQMEKREIPGFPCLVIKNNERLKVKNANTRSGEATYEFISDAFDGSKRIEKPVTRDSYYDVAIDEETDLDAGLPKKMIPDICIQAWEELGNVPNAFQRDYIYYNINKTNQPGTLNRNIREKIFRFRVSTKSVYDYIKDQDDPNLQDCSQKKRYLTVEEIKQRIWTEGNFEFKISSFISGETSDKSMELSKVFTLTPQQVFNIKKVHLHHKNNTAFRHSKNTYTVDENDLMPRWIYLEKMSEYSDENFVFTEPWDLYGTSLSIYLFISEIDGKETVEEKRTVINEFANKGDFSLTGGGSIGGIALNAKLGYGLSNTHKTSSETTIRKELESEDLGSVSFRYYDPIIRGKDSKGNYKLYNASTGNIIVTLMPINTNE